MLNAHIGHEKLGGWFERSDLAFILQTLAGGIGFDTNQQSFNMSMMLSPLLIPFSFSFANSLHSFSASPRMSWTLPDILDGKDCLVLCCHPLFLLIIVLPLEVLPSF